MELKNTEINDKNDVINSDRPNSETEEQALSLGISAKESGITIMPAPILKAMLKESFQLAYKGKPGADDGSFIVAGA
jgi:hypothetical protein